MIRISRDAGAKVLLIGTELPPNYGSAYRDRFRAVYSDLARRHDLVLLPFLLAGVALEPGLMQDDGLHPTAAAQPRVLDNVRSDEHTSELQSLLLISYAVFCF